MARQTAAKSKASDAVRPANPERGEITLILDGSEFVLRPTHEAIEAFETATGKGLLQLAREALNGQLRLAEVAQVTAECIRAWGRATNDRVAQAVGTMRIGELLLEADGGFVNALKTVSVMLSLATTGGYTAQGEVKAGTTTTSAAVPAS